MRGLFFLFLLVNISLCSSQSDLARNHISILTSDSLAGRGFTENGQEKAANFLIDKLKNFHVQAIGNTGYKQELSYPVNTFPGDVQFSIDNQRSIKIFAAGKDFLFHSASAPIEINGQIEPVSADFIFPKKRDKQIFYIEKGDLNAKAVDELIDSFLFKTDTKGHLLIVQDSAKWSWFPSSEQSENTVLFVKDQLEKNSNISVKNEAHFLSDFHSSNILGMIEGERSDSVIMLSAHYDHLGTMGSVIFRGANDNASGVAMLLALAKYYGENKPQYDTYFLFTTAEEIGLLGSYYFLENPLLDLSKLKMLINLDMVGTGNKGITVVNANKHQQFYDVLKAKNNHRIVDIKARGEACNSDHCLFDQIGLPAIFIYTLGGKQAYHDIYDNGEDLSLEAFDELHDLIIESLNEY